MLTFGLHKSRAAAEVLTQSWVHVWSSAPCSYLTFSALTTPSLKFPHLGNADNTPYLLGSQVSSQTQLDSRILANFQNMENESDARNVHP